MMIMQESQFEKVRSTMHPGTQFLVFALLFVGIYIVGNIIGAALVTVLYGLKTLMAVAAIDTTNPHFLASLWILQITGTTLTIFSAAVIFGFSIMREPKDYLKLSSRFSWILIVLVFAIMLVSNPLIEFLANLNQKMVLPPFLKWMKDSEESAQKLTEAMLQMKSIWDVILDVLAIGLLTAIVEEFMFRGVLQTILVRWTNNIHAAVWITAILFSAFHLQFFGFLPRVMLGVLFGYFVAWSGSIWTSVWAHFLNNGAAVVATYLFQQKIIKSDPDDQHLFSAGAYMISLVIVVFLLFVYRKTAVEKKQIPAY
jgi:membrane protease YdiL (CAAX protease family)